MTFDDHLRALAKETARWSHEAGCPAIADDESDQVLADYGECVCEMRERIEAFGREVAARQQEADAQILERLRQVHLSHVIHIDMAVEAIRAPLSPQKEP